MSGLAGLELPSWVRDIHNAKPALNFDFTIEYGWLSFKERFGFSAGGLVRDCSGNWQFGFGMNIALFSDYCRTMGSFSRSSPCLGSRYSLLDCRGG